MGTRTILVVGAVGAVMFAAAAFAFNGGGGKSAVPEAAKATSDGQSASNTSRPGATSPSGTSTVTRASDVKQADDQGAVAPASPPVPPEDFELVKNGGRRFAIPLKSWTSIGERFGAPRSNGRILGGINFLFAGKTMDVVSSCDGFSNGASSDKIYGTYVVIDCNDGWMTLYANLASVTVNTRQDVLQGQTVVGTAKDMLHFELRWRRIPIDPEPYLDFAAASGAPRPEPTLAAPEATETATGTPSATPSTTATVTTTATATATPARTATPVPSNGGGDGSNDGTNPDAQPTDVPATAVPPTATPVPPTATATAVPPTPTATVTPTPVPPQPTRTPTPKPVAY